MTTITPRPRPRNAVREFNSKRKNVNLAVVVMFLNIRRTWSFHVVVLQRTVTKCTKIYITHVHSHCSSH